MFSCQNLKQLRQQRIKMCECGQHSGPNNVAQSLDELEFERGLWFAAQYGDIDRAHHLINQGFYVDQRDAAGYTALHYAARNGHLNICRLLIDKGANINATTKHGKATALHRAAALGKLDVLKFLIDKKANCNLKDADERTPLHKAAINKHFQIFNYLLKVSPNLRDMVDNHEKKAEDYLSTEEKLRVAIPD